MPHFRFYAQSPTNAAAGNAPRVDRQNLTIRGVVAMQSGVEALGHGCMTDNKTIQIMLKLAQDGKPRRQRFGHPGISENATGKQVAQAVNFSIVNGNLVHDSIFLESARKSPAFSQDPVEYIFNLAEKSPSEFGESVVIEADLAWTLSDGRDVPQYQSARNNEDRQRNATFIDIDGVERHSHNFKPVDAQTDLPVLRPSTFHYVDYVNEGALTHEGMFSKMFMSGPSAWAEELFHFVDEWRTAYNIPLTDVPKKADQLLTAYMQVRSSKDTAMKRGQFTTNVAATAEKFDSAEQEETILDSEQEPSAEATNSDNDPLSAAESLAAQLVSPTVEASADSGILAEMTARIDQLEGAIERISAKFDRLVALQIQQLEPMLELRSEQVKHKEALLALQSEQVKHKEAMQILERNQKRLDGDHVVTQKVPKTPASALEPLPTFAHPTPAGMQFSKPVGMGNRPAAAGQVTAAANPLQRSIEIQNARSVVGGENL